MQSRETLLAWGFVLYKTPTSNYQLGIFYMKDNYKPISKKVLWISGAVLVLFIGLPTVALGDSFVVSLIQGKTPAEAVNIIAVQVDQLFGRVTTLESDQVQSSDDIEHLKLENENLRLQNDILAKQASSTAQEVTANKKDAQTVSECESLEHQLYCAVTYAPIYTAKLILLPNNTSVSAVLAALGEGADSNWYASSTNKICIKAGNSHGVFEQCTSLPDMIIQINSDRTSGMKINQRTLDDFNKIIQQYKPRYNDLKCDALLQEYAPARQKPGCA